MSSNIGTRFNVTTFGESHGLAIGAIVDGCPSLIPLSEADIQIQLDRRRPGQSHLTTSRKEKDKVSILSGIDRGLTLGTPIALMIQNTDCKPLDYEALSKAPRPSHADYTCQIKYRIRTGSGGGRASARETVGRVAAGAIAEQFLKTVYNVEIVAWVSSAGTVDAPVIVDTDITREQVDLTAVRCPDPESAKQMVDLIKKTKRNGDSIGGIITCVCSNIPAGWGEPVFDKLNAVLAHAMMSIPAAKGFEIGSGFAGARMRGSEHNDLFVKKGHMLGTATNRSGGIQGGISNGEPIVFRVAFKPASTIAREQKTADYKGNMITLKTQGRHDPCVVPRAVPIVESMAAIVLADAALCHYPRS